MYIGEDTGNAYSSNNINCAHMNIIKMGTTFFFQHGVLNVLLKYRLLNSVRIVMKIHEN